MIHSAQNYGARFSVGNFNEVTGSVLTSIPPVNVTQRDHSQAGVKLHEKRRHYRKDDMLGVSAFTSTPHSQSQLRADIDGIFRDRNFCNEMLFNKFIIEDLQDCNISNIARFMRLAGKKSKSKSNDYLRGHLPLIASRLRTSISSSWTYMNISNIIYGLQCLPSTETESEALT